MVRLTARYDGKVLIPDQPLDLPTDTPLEITIQPSAPPPAGDDPLMKLYGLGKEVWEGVDALEYQRQEREGWE